MKWFTVKSNAECLFRRSVLNVMRMFSRLFLFPMAFKKSQSYIFYQFNFISVIASWKAFIIINQQLPTRGLRRFGINTKIWILHLSFSRHLILNNIFLLLNISVFTTFVSLINSSSYRRIANVSNYCALT